MTTMDKVYNPAQVEEALYRAWEEKGYFTPQVDPDKKPFCIVIPPPNITGQLHMGHALDNMMQDAIIRFKRMQGYSTLWLPGTDHASIATEVKVVDAMAEEGLTKEAVGREKFLERAWDWKREYGGRIVRQLRKLGSSCDWSRERFTMDEGCSKAVVEVFVRLYEKGLIYQGSRIINWCPDCKTALSDTEVEYEQQQGNFWHIRYPYADGTGFVTVATTRPETMLGDTAVAVHPDDPRYQDLIGKEVILPIVNKPIPVVADTYVDMEFGTGVVKITPAHDPNDFEVGLRHNLPVIRVMDDEGRMNEEAGAFCGQDRYEARKNIVDQLQAEGLLEKIEPHDHNVGVCYRCHTTVEPIISKQWFVKMKPLAEPAIEAVRNGDIRFVPDRFSKTYFNWMENIRDWCISRQLWWGHRIPAWHCADCGHTTVSRTTPDKCEKCGSIHIAQDEDVLDTWFSSALWPFSTLGWPEQTEALKYWYPTNVLVTGYDIITFWVSKMIFSGLEYMGEKPFDTVLIHGLVRDSQGRKMSKSLGNGIDPLEVIEKYGADSLRFSLATGNSPGNDMRFYWERVESARNFANKIWNAARFVNMNLDGKMPERPEEADLELPDRWMLTRFNALVVEITDNLEKFELGMAAGRLYDFIWSEYCDWYIELTKSRLQEGEGARANAAKWVLRYVLEGMLKLLHPFMPFVTEAIYQSLPGAGESIMISSWPEDNGMRYPEQEKLMQGVMELIRAVRNIRSEMNVPASRKATLLLLAGEGQREPLISCREYFLKLASAQDVVMLGDRSEIPPQAASAVCPMAEAYLPLNELIDTAKELERLGKERKRLEGEIARATAKLNNPGFVNKAPEKVVCEERSKLATFKDMLAKLVERVEMLNKLA